MQEIQVSVTHPEDSVQTTPALKENGDLRELLVLRELLGMTEQGGEMEYRELKAHRECLAKLGQKENQEILEQMVSLLNLLLVT